ncbi:MAG: hypothetical protein AB9879_14720 [Methanothrix sp.]
MTILKNVWGETIKKISVFMVLAMALFFAPAVAENAIGGDSVDILHNGIFETDGNAFSFPVDANTNYGSVSVGNDKATSFGMGSSFPFGFRNGPANAQNNLEIKKNQDAGPRLDDFGEFDINYKLNIEQIKVGDRTAQAFGYATAINNVKIVTNQE